MKESQPRLQCAFTLHEALITLAIASIITTLAIPSFQQILSSQRVTAGVNTLITALYMARSEAIKRRENAVLCPSTNMQTCTRHTKIWEDGYLLFIDANDNRTIDMQETVVQIFEATNGIRLRNTSQHDHVRYLPNGLATLTNATFIICDINDQTAPKAVVISNSGRPRVTNRLPNGEKITCPTAS